MLEDVLSLTISILKGPLLRFPYYYVTQKNDTCLLFSALRSDEAGKQDVEMLQKFHASAISHQKL